MSYDPSNPPAMITPAGLTGIPWGSQWALNTDDDIATIEATPRYISDAARLGMKLGDIVWVRRTSNGRVWRSTVVSMSPVRALNAPLGTPAGGAATLGESQTMSVGQTTAAEVGWSGLLNGAAGSAIRFTGTPPTISVAGTFGTGGSVRMEGSNDGVTWSALSIPARTSAGAFQSFGVSADVYVFYRPNVTAGNGSTSLTVTF